MEDKKQSEAQFSNADAGVVSSVFDKSFGIVELFGTFEGIHVSDTDTLDCGAAPLLCDSIKYNELVPLSRDKLWDEVKDIDKEDMLEKIKTLKGSYMDSNKFKISLQSEKSAVYVRETRRFAYDGKVRATHADSALVSAILTKLEHNLISSICGVTPRHLYYVVKNQLAVDIKMIDVIKINDDLCCFWGCTRKSIGMGYSPSSSSFGGCISLKETDMEGNEIITECTNMAKAYPIDMNSTFKIEKSISRPAKFILVLEKDTVFERLVREDKFAHKYKCILVCGKGQPDIQCRLFVRKLYDTLKIPVLILVDFNVYGIEIVKSYMVSSYNMALQSSHLVIPSIKFLGLSGDDLKQFQVKLEQLKPMTEVERKKIVKLSKENWVNEDIKSSLELHLKWGKRADIEILEIVHGYSFLSNVYLPEKLKQLGLA
ncbi:hypothetical protein RND81_06G246100 [Saponaria officinalis]|uniref:Topoisomerase 6 subunit A/Spo11 TOPRIM domain-containing protein n=1 Tax=Saponaria officinalis TaxID=3572 RepID=A0AAW1KEP7_SAPOF